MTAELDIAIIGAGPSSLTIVNQLALRHPSWFSKNPTDEVPSIKVIDPAGWMGKWNSLFTNLEIEKLRSPATFHIDAGFGDGLIHYAHEQKMEDQLSDLPAMHARLGRGRNRCKHNRHFTPQDLQRILIPSSKLFDSHCSHTVSKYGLEDLIIPSKCLDIQRLQTQGYILKLENNTDIRARIVIVAIGCSLPNVPPVFGELYRLGEIKHILNFEQKIQAEHNNSYLIVGGGLSAAQLAIKACAGNGSTATLCVRGRLRKSQFDVPIEWIGRNSGRYLANFYSLDLEQRLGAVKEIRGGGSIPFDYLEQLYALIRVGKLIIHENAIVENICRTTFFQVDIKHADTDVVEREHYNHVWLATGIDLNAKNETIFSSLAKNPYPGNLPLLTEGKVVLTVDLEWKDSSGLFVLGAYALLNLGPGAMNLSGSMESARRVVPVVEHYLSKKWKKKNQQKMNGVHPVDPVNSNFVSKSRKYVGSTIGNMYSLLDE